MDVPNVLQDQRFMDSWAEWLEYRKERRLTRVPKCLERQLKFLANLGLEGALESLDQSIRCGWQGLFEPKSKKTQTQFGSIERFMSRGQN